MKIKTSDLAGRALDWAVATAIGHEITSFSADSVSIQFYSPGGTAVGIADYSPSADWSMSGPLIDRYQVELFPTRDGDWSGLVHKPKLSPPGMRGAIPTIALCRAIVAAELGAEVEIPEELL